MTTSLSRREWLERSACGFGSLALLGPAGRATLGQTASVGQPVGSEAAALPARAKRVVFLFMHGGVSHVDTFDPKPKLAEENGRPLPIAKPKFEFARPATCSRRRGSSRGTARAGSRSATCFRTSARCIDDICVIRSMNGGNQVSHGPALLDINTGSGVFARPSLGAWTLYGLGTENQNLPGFISLSPSLYHGGAQNYGSAFLPASFQGTRIGDGSTTFKDAKLSNLTPGDDPALQRLQLDLLARRNRDHLERVGDAPQLEARIDAFEMAFRMQARPPRSWT